MLKNLLFTFGFFLMSSLMVFAQSGALKGRVIDKDTQEPIPFANIVIEVGGSMVGGATSDFEGNYTIKPIPPGTYDIKSTYVGYKPLMIQGMVINADQIRFHDIKMESTAVEIEEFVVEAYDVPLIDKDETAIKNVKTAKEIAKMPNRNVNSIAATAGGVYSADGGVSNVRGARGDATVYYIDGIRVVGSQNLPQSAIEQVAVILGGAPAQYGDARGGIINVTTKGASRKFGAGLELESSEFLDAFGHNRVGFNMMGPLIKGNNENNTSLLGYFIAGDLSYDRDGRPTANGIYMAQDEVYDNLYYNPLRPSGTGSGTYPNGEFIGISDLTHVDATPNTAQYGATLSGKLDVRTSTTSNLTFGGQFVYNNRNNFSNYWSMFNSDRNLEITNRDWRVYGRYTQRFPSDPESRSLIKNVYYTLQADYSQSETFFMDPYHKDDIFKYGYLGKFETYKEPTFEWDPDNFVFKLNSWDFDTAYVFTPWGGEGAGNERNKAIARYTEQIYGLYPDKEGYWQNSTQLTEVGGLLNGQQPEDFYGLWGPAGVIQTTGGYSNGHFKNRQVSANVAASMDVGNHEVKFGFQYEQRMNSSIRYDAVELWRLMRQLTNRHIRELDFDNGYTLEGVNDIIYYPRKYDAISQSTFDKNLREKLDLETNGLDFILTDSYDFENGTIDYYDQDGVRHTVSYDGDLYSLDMFSAEELLRDGNFYARYMGYDYMGNELTTLPTLDDFFTETDANGDYTRKVGAYVPIYMAGYIQDKFSFHDLVFNVGLRIDRFDANQQVLKDPFTLYPAYTAGEVTSQEHPGNIEDDYVVYIKSFNDRTIVGYRDGITWYNASGVEISDPNILDVDGTGVTPDLKDPNNQVLSVESFKDYEPQWSPMPRIAFSFPISDEALFFAHYDILTQRPTERNVGDPALYYYYEQLGNVNFPNPNLKPATTIDYEIGFQQKLNRTSSLKINAFYREMRDDITLYMFSGAYPGPSYNSFVNMDFGTVKGLTITYDLRRTNNVRVNASYTLQYAEGTGSSATTAANLIASGYPNLRTLNPYNWDQRHGFNMMIDYRFTDGKEYNGPSFKKGKGTDSEKTVNILQNTGVNFVINGGSGVPYTAQKNITGLTTGGTRELEGTFNGSRLPWQFRVDMRLDRDINTSWGKNDNIYFNVYLQVLNLFNQKNILGVYPATGNANDDGFLAAAEWQTEIENQLDSQSFRDLYTLALINPGWYSAPRQIRLGLSLNF